MRVQKEQQAEQAMASQPFEDMSEVDQLHTVARSIASRSAGDVGETDRPTMQRMGKADLEHSLAYATVYVRKLENQLHDTSVALRTAQGMLVSSRLEAISRQGVLVDLRQRVNELEERVARAEQKQSNKRKQR